MGEIVDSIKSLVRGFFGVFSHGLHHLEIGSLFIGDSGRDEELRDKVDSSLVISAGVFDDPREGLF